MTNFQTPNNTQYPIINNQTGRFGYWLLGIGIYLVIGVWLLVISPVCFAANEAALVREGNQLYNKGKLDDALKNYNQALTKVPDAPLINFNIGNSLYKKAQYDQAAQAYEKALLSADKKIETKANYNIGNCKFRQGKLKEFSDLGGAISEYRLSLDYYKRAIELDPDDKDAKFNHEFVEKLLKSLIDKLAKQEQQKQQEQQRSGKLGQEGQKPQDQKTEEQKNQQGQQEKQEAQPEQQKGQEGEGRQNQKTEELKDEEAEEQDREQEAQQAQAQKAQQEGQQGQEDYQPGGQMQQAAKGPDKEMTKEEARMLLDDYRQQEQQERQLGDRHAPMRYPDVDKDW